jgi:exonuclease III
MHTCLEIGSKSGIDFILIQEPWIADDNTTTVSHSAYYTILLNTQGVRPRVAVFTRKKSKFQYCQRTDICSDSDIIVLDISSPTIETFQLINIYNEKSLKEEETEWTIERSLQHINIDRKAIVCGDFNTHYSWWNSGISTVIRAAKLVEWLERSQLELMNKLDKSTFSRKGMVNTSVIDLIFITPKLN